MRKFEFGDVCKRGHERTPETTYIDNKGRRTCRTCRNEQERERVAALRKSDPEFLEQERKRAREYQRARRARDPEFREQGIARLREATRRLASDPELLKRHRERQRQAEATRWRKDPGYRERRRVLSLASRYGLTIEVAQAALAAMPSACEICGRQARLHFDHCHKTGRHRGWLCNNCNWAIGLLQDAPSIVRAAADYLESR